MMLGQCGPALAGVSRECQPKLDRALSNDGRHLSTANRDQHGPAVDAEVSQARQRHDGHLRHEDLDLGPALVWSRNLHYLRDTRADFLGELAQSIGLSGTGRLVRWCRDDAGLGAIRQTARDHGLYGTQED